MINILSSSVDVILNGDPDDPIVELVFDYYDTKFERHECLLSIRRRDIILTINRILLNTELTEKIVEQYALNKKEAEYTLKNKKEMVGLQAVTIQGFPVEEVIMGLSGLELDSVGWCMLMAQYVDAIQRIVLSKIAA